MVGSGAGPDVKDENVQESSFAIAVEVTDSFSVQQVHPACKSCSCLVDHVLIDVARVQPLSHTCQSRLTDSSSSDSSSASSIQEKSVFNASSTSDESPDQDDLISFEDCATPLELLKDPAGGRREEGRDENNPSPPDNRDSLLFRMVTWQY